MYSILNLRKKPNFSHAYTVLGSELAVTSQEVNLGVASVSSLLCSGQKGKQAVRNY